VSSGEDGLAWRAALPDVADSGADAGIRPLRRPGRVLAEPQWWTRGARANRW